jgi:hypothetical protein
MFANGRFPCWKILFCSHDDNRSGRSLLLEAIPLLRNLLRHVKPRLDLLIRAGKTVLIIESLIYSQQ